MVSGTIKHVESKWAHTGAIFLTDHNGVFVKNTALTYLPNGISVIEYLYRTLACVCQNVVLVGNSENLPDSLSNVKQVPVYYSNVGPIGGLEALLSSGIDTEYLITPSDLGLVDTRMYQLLTQAHIPSPAIIASPQVGSSSTPHQESVNAIDYPQIGRYSASSVMTLREQIIRKDFSMDRLALRMDPVRMVIPEDLTYTLMSTKTAQEDIVFSHLN